ncbi:tyrosine-type recombinase/integrase [Microvirga tunisiensis]|uniref:Integrase family protein n=1 Tax=Microvirga tunisiensis TaxID=2108360 RepID=A0A5N7MV45_9HYPH|nr:integrase family protein [Microvirga tunisiensis]MPR12382.1 integrase family protein [Microvirga tunisiensis]MPR30339.1 integrase family protein [Microvirga tunisiensis]
MAPPLKRKLRLSDAIMRKLPVGRSWDTDIGGFGAKVYTTGKVQFILRYRSRDKRQREFRIGQFGVINTDEARRKARVLLGRISEGHDPAWERKVELASATLFNEVIDRYLVWAQGHHKESSFKEVSRFGRLHIRRHFGDVLVSDLTRGQVQRVYDRLRQAPHVRAKIIQWSRAIWAWAEKRDLVGDSRNPFVIVISVRKPRRDRVLSSEEYQRLWAALERHRYRGVIPNVSLWAIEFLMLSPLRKTEAFRLRWENVDFVQRVIRVVEHKTDRHDGVLDVFMSDALEQLLRTIPRCCDWVFPRPDARDGHIASVDKGWLTIRKEAGLHEGRDRVTLHDLRRSWNSVGAKLGYGPEAMGRVLGNSARVNEVHYWHLAADLKREITARVAETVAGFRQKGEIPVPHPDLDRTPLA